MIYFCDNTKHTINDNIKWYREQAEHRFLQIRVKGTLKNQAGTKVRSGDGQNCTL